MKTYAKRDQARWVVRVLSRMRKHSPCTVTIAAPQKVTGPVVLRFRQRFQHSFAVLNAVRNTVR